MHIMDGQARVIDGARSDVPKGGRRLCRRRRVQLQQEIVEGKSVVANQIIQQLAQHSHVADHRLHAQGGAVPLRVEVVANGVVEAGEEPVL